MQKPEAYVTCRDLTPTLLCHANMGGTLEEEEKALLKSPSHWGMLCLHAEWVRAILQASDMPVITNTSILI